MSAKHNWTLAQVAEIVGGVLDGDGNRICDGIEAPDLAGPSHVTMIEETATLEKIAANQIAGAIVSVPVQCDVATILVDDTRAAFAKLAITLRPPLMHSDTIGIASTATIGNSTHIHPTAIIGDGTIIGDHTRVGPGVVIGPQCHVGHHTIIDANVTVYAYTEIGNHVTLQAGVVLGAQGFGYQLVDGRHESTSQLGYVVVEDDVELGASVTVDRGTYASTRIGRGTKIDNQVMIAHNCQIGRHNLICSQVGIAGSCRTGDYVVLAGQVGIKDHITLGNQVIVGAQAGVMENLADDNVYLGSPATPQREQMQIMAVERRLPQMRRDLKKLAQQVARLETQSNGDASAAKPSNLKRRAA